MSKVKSFLDSKTKAKHRMRRQETRSKKLSRYNNHRKHIYHWYKSGYYPRSRNRAAWYLSPEECMINGHGYLKRYGCTKILKECKRTTSRALRRNKRFDEETYTSLRGKSYKKIYDLDSALW